MLYREEYRAIIEVFSVLLRKSNATGAQALTKSLNELSFTAGKYILSNVIAQNDEYLHPQFAGLLIPPFITAFQKLLQKQLVNGALTECQTSYTDYTLSTSLMR